MVAFSSLISVQPIVNTIVVGRIIDIFEHILLAQFAGRLKQRACRRLWHG
jgi:hypothetical protein